MDGWWQGRLLYLVEKREHTKLETYARMAKAGVPEAAVLHKMRADGVAADIIAMLCPSPATGVGGGSNTQSQPKSSGPALEEDTGASRWLKSDVVLSVEDVRQLLEATVAELTVQRKPSPAKVRQSRMDRWR